MKQSNVTGREIYDAIWEKEQEVKQYDIALKELKHRGTAYAPYQLLDKQRQSVAMELNKLMDSEYVISNMKTSFNKGGNF